MPLEKSPVTLATLQKDNDPQWIEDWCTWHHRVHGIGRIIIYDNGSANFEEVSARLASLPGIECIFVHWPYPYGTVRNSGGRYCQPGALNHTRLLFGRHTKWCVNLDIDEYLYTPRGVPLARYLRKPMMRMLPVLYMPGYWVSDTAAVDDKAARRCFNFHLRRSRLTLETKKFIYQPAKISYIQSVHEGVVRFSQQRLGKLYCWLHHRFLAWRIYSRWHGLLGFSRESAWFFYHFRGLNSKWKVNFYNQETQEYYRTFFLDTVPDDRIPAMKDKLD